MKKYFIYYSYTGNGDYLATIMKDLGFELIKVETIKEYGKLTFFKMLCLGRDAMIKKQEPIKELGLDIKEDDLVVIGSPIWNDRLSTPINTVLKTLELDKETTKFILYPAGATTKKALKQINRLAFMQSPVIIASPLKHQEQARQIIGSFISK